MASQIDLRRELQLLNQVPAFLQLRPIASDIKDPVFSAIVRQGLQHEFQIC